jgi:hypothetical protein
MNGWKKLLTIGALGLFFLWGVVASLGWYGERQRRLEERERSEGIINQLQRYAQKGFSQNAQEARARGENRSGNRPAVPALTQGSPHAPGRGGTDEPKRAIKRH